MLFGGVSGIGGTKFADTWEWDGTNWTQASPTTSPTARSVHHNMSYDPIRKVVVLIAGQIGPGFASENDIWEYDGTTWKDVTGSASFTTRSASCVAFDGTSILLFGGGQWDPMFNDTWKWQGTSLSLQGPTTVPPARMSTMCAYDDLRKRVTMMAGTRVNSTTQFTDDMWDWDGANWTQLTTKAPEGDTCCQVLAYDSTRKETLYFTGRPGRLDRRPDVSDSGLRYRSQPFWRALVSASRRPWACSFSYTLFT